jgi:hypothetical protein
MKVKMIVIVTTPTTIAGKYWTYQECYTEQFTGWIFVFFELHNHRSDDEWEGSGTVAIAEEKDKRRGQERRREEKREERRREWGGEVRIRWKVKRGTQHKTEEKKEENVEKSSKENVWGWYFCSWWKVDQT